MHSRLAVRFLLTIALCLAVQPVLEYVDHASAESSYVSAEIPIVFPSSTSVPPVLTGAAQFSTDSSGTSAGGQSWNTLGGDPPHNLYVTQANTGISGAFLNTGNDAVSTRLNVALTPGTHTFYVFGEPGNTTEWGWWGLNLFFDSDDATPRISTYAPTAPAPPTQPPAFQTNISASTPDLGFTQLVPGSGSLSYSNGSYLVTLTDYWYTLPISYNLDRVQAQNNVPSGRTDFLGRFTLSVSPVSTACLMPPAGLVGWWPGDGNTVDLISGNYGTVEGGVTFAPGEVGQAFSLDGHTGSVLVGNPTALQLQTFTIGAWIKRASTTQASLDTDTGAVFGYATNGYILGLWSDGLPFLSKTGVSNITSSASRVTDTAWHHLAVTKSGSTVTFYIDGVADEAAPYDPGFTFETNAGIGAPDGYLRDSFLGLVDEVQVYNRALTSPEVSAIYSAGGAGLCKPPTLQASPDRLSFAATQGSPNPVDQQVQMSNLGGGTLSWSAAASTGSSGNWLSVSPTSGTLEAGAGGTLAIHVDSSGLAAGTYSGTITVTGVDGTTGNPKQVAVSLKVSPSACALSPTGLVGWWPGDGNASDIVGRNNGTLLGPTSFATAEVGEGFSFDSDDDGVSVPDDASLNVQSSGFAASFWMKGAKNQPDQLFLVVDKSHGIPDYSGWVFQGDSTTGQITFAIGAGGMPFPAVTSSADVLDGRFHLITGTWDGAIISLYVDGASQGTASLATPANNTRPMNLGYWWGGGTYPRMRFFRGILDELQIFNRALLVNEIQSIYNAGTVGQCKKSTATPTPTSTPTATPRAWPITYQAPSDPVTQGFPGVIQVGPLPQVNEPIDDDLGYPAWSISGGGQSTQFAYASGALSDAQKAEIASQGFTLTLRGRGLQGSALAYDAGYNTTIGGAVVDIGSRRYDLAFGINSSGNTVVVLDTTLDLYGPGGSVRATGPSYTLSDAGCHTYDLVFSPQTQSASLFIDGIERITGYTGHTLFLVDDGLRFGAWSGGGMNFNLVRLAPGAILPSTPTPSPTPTDTPTASPTPTTTPTPFGTSLQTEPSYRFTVEQNTQNTESVQLTNPGGVSRSATLAISNPHSPQLAVSPVSQGPITVAPGATEAPSLRIDATGTAVGVYDGILLSVAVDDGTTLVSNITVYVTPPGAPPLPDLAIDGGDISASSTEPGRPVDYGAIVHNKGDVEAVNVSVRYYDFGEFLREITIGSIPANGSAPTSIYIDAAPSGDSVIQVIVDNANSIPELDETNNEASRVIRRPGGSDGTGAIRVTGSAPSAPVCTGSLVYITGHAVYDIRTAGGWTYPVKGGSVQVTADWPVLHGDIHTDVDGNFARYLLAPQAPGSYKVGITVTDYTMSSQPPAELTVEVELCSTPHPPETPPLWPSGDWVPHTEPGPYGPTTIWVYDDPPGPESDFYVYSEDIAFVPSHPASGELVRIAAQIHYFARRSDQKSPPVSVSLYAIGAGGSKVLIGQTPIGGLNGGSSSVVYGKWPFPLDGIYIVEAEINPSYVEPNTQNNAATRAIIVGSSGTNRWSASGQVRDSSGGVPGVPVHVSDSSGTLGSTTTDDRGFYLVENLPVGDVQVRIEVPPGYTPDAETKTATGEDQKVTNVDFDLTRQVAPVSNPPMARSQTISTAEDTAVTVTLIGSDSETASGDLTFAIMQPPTHGALSGTAPNLTYTPEANYSGPDGFTFTVTDRGSPDNCGAVGPSCSAALTSSPATVSITVTPANDPPAVVADAKSTAEDTSLTFPFSDLTANDSTGPADESSQALTVVSVAATADAHGTVALNPEGAITYTPEGNYNGSAAFCYTIQDDGTTNGAPDPKQAIGTVNVTIAPVNDKPTADAKSASTDEDMAVSITLTGSDLETALANLGFSVTTPPAHGKLSGTGASLTYTPDLNYNGSDSFAYAVTDRGDPDNCGSSSTTCAAALTSDPATVSITVKPVNDPPVATSSSASQIVQYSDPIAAVTISGTDVDSPSLTSSPAWSRDGKTYQPGLPIGLALEVGNCSSPDGVSGDCTWTLDGKMLVAPGTYTVRVTVSDDSQPSPQSTFTDIDIKVSQEDARPTYTGAFFVSTSSPTSTTATVTLAATVQDITSVDPAHDPSPGDIRNATVTFVNRDVTPNAVLCRAPIGLVSLADQTTGTTTCDWTTDIGTFDSQQYTIGVVVGGYYVAPSGDLTVVTVSKPLPSNYIAGAGYLTLTSSNGLKAGDANTKNNFGFGVKYNKGGTNLQGRVNTIVRRTEADGTLHFYQIKGNVMTSLAVRPSPCPNATPSAPCTATFNGRASIKDITDPLNPISVDGNATLQVTMTDKGKPGTSDTIAITVWNKAGGLWFASNWTGKTTAEQALGGGDLVVH